MPWAPYMPCTYPGCGKLADKGRCSRHQRDRQFYSKKPWREFRELFLSRHRTCAICGKPSKVVHHVMLLHDYPLLAYAESNCEALCVVCHNRITATAM